MSLRGTTWYTKDRIDFQSLFSIVLPSPSLPSPPPGSGSSGWQAPEQMDGGGRRQTKAVDLFSLGSVVFFCVAGGRHPFGEWYERDANVLAGRADLFPIDHVPEAVDLVASLLLPDPDAR